MKLKILAAFLVFSTGLLIADTDNKVNDKKPDKDKPVSASDIQLARKISVKGKPATGGGRKPGRGAMATGLLGQPLAGNRYALVIGISNYPGSANDLDYCDDDADVMSSTLISIYGFTDVIVLKDTAATRGAILNAIESLSAIVNSGDEVVFFFSGHGANGIASDGDSERVDESIVVCNNNNTDITFIWDGELSSAFSDFATSRIILIFDSCLSGGMQPDLQTPGRIIAMASQERGYSYETDELQNGEFTYYFAKEGMLAGLANIHDYNLDSSIHQPSQVTIEEACDYAQVSCSLDKPLFSDSFDNDLLP
jgi:hypothetical protein